MKVVIVVIFSLFLNINLYSISKLEFIKKNKLQIISGDEISYDFLKSLCKACKLPKTEKQKENRFYILYVANKGIKADEKIFDFDIINLHDDSDPKEGVYPISIVEYAILTKNGEVIMKLNLKFEIEEIYNEKFKKYFTKTKKDKLKSNNLNKLDKNKKTVLDYAYKSYLNDKKNGKKVLEYLKSIGAKRACEILKTKCKDTKVDK